MRVTTRFCQPITLALQVSSAILLTVCFSVTKIQAQCPQVEAIMVDACSVEQNNEFIIIHSGTTGFNTADIELDFDANNNIISQANNDINTDNGNFAANPAPCGLTMGNTGAFSGCTNLIAVGPGTMIPPNSIVILQTSAGSAGGTYNAASLCGAGQCVYVIASNCARTAGGFSNAGAGMRTTNFSIAGGCNQTITYDQTQLTGGNGAYYLPSGSYGNGGCTVPPSSPAPSPPNVNDIPNVVICGSYTLPAITGTNITANAAYFSGPNRTGTQYAPGDVISMNTTIYIHDYNGLNTCDDEENFTITISAAPTVNMPADISVCGGQPVSVAVTGSAGATFPWTNDNTAVGLGATGTGNINFTAASVLATEVAMITITPTQGTCPGTPVTFSITVNPGPTVDDPANAMACGGDAVAIVFTGSAASYSWVNSTPSIGLPATGTGDIAFTAANVSNLTVATVTVTAVQAPCAGQQQVFTITINPAGSVNQPPNIVDCGGNLINVGFTGSANTTFNWTNDNPAIGLGGSGTGNISFTSAAVGVQEVATITVIPTRNGCDGPPRTFTITIDPGPSADDPGDQNVCGNTPVNVNFTGTASSYSWTNSNTNIGLPAFGAGNISFTSANVATTQTATITLTPEGPSCDGPSITFTITVNPPATLTQPANQSACAGANVAVNFTGSTGALFNWTNNNTAIGLPASGSGPINFTAAAVATTQIATITVIPNNAGNCPGPSRTFTITITPGPTVNALATTNFCSQAPAVINFTGSTGATFAWTNTNIAIGLGATGTGNINFTTANVSAPQTGNITVTPSIPGCVGAPENFQITVNPVATVAQPANQSACAGANVAVNFTGNTGALFNWTNSNPAIGLSASGSGNLSFTAANTATQQVATITVTPTNAANCPGAAVTFTITINPNPTTPTVANIAFCGGQAANIPLTGSPGSLVSWTNSNPAIGLGAAGSGDIAFTAASVSAAITATITIQATANTCNGTQQSFIITVNPTPTVNAVASQQACAGAPVTVNFAGTGTPAPTFNWTNSNTTIGLAASGTGNISFTAANVASTQMAAIAVTPVIGTCSGTVQNFNITINNNPTLTIGTITCAPNLLTYGVSLSSNATNVTSSAGTVTNSGGGNYSVDQIPAGTNVTITAVNPSTGCDAIQSVNAPNCNCPTVAAPTGTSNQVVCEGLATPAFAAVVAAGQAADWYISPSGGTAIFTGLSFTPTGVSGVGTYTFYVEARDIATGCVSNPRTPVTLTVNPTPSVNQTIDQTFCAGTTAAISFSGTGSPNFNWTNSNINIGLGASGTGNIAFTTPSVSTTQTGEIIVTPVLGTCPGIADTFNIVINPLPVLTIDTLFCAPDLLSYTAIIQTNILNLTTSAGIISTTGPSFTIVQIPADTNIVVVGLSTLTACNNNLNVAAPNCNCPPVAAPSNPNNPVICSALAIPALTVSAGTGIVISWFNTPTGGTSVGTGTSFTPAGPLVPGTYTFYAEASDPQTGCLNATRTPVTLTINLTPTMVATPNQSVCAQGTLIVNFNGTLGNVYNWTNTNTATGLAASGTGNISFTAANVLAPTVSNIQVTPVLGTCSGTPQNFTMTVNELPAISVTSINCAPNFTTYSIILTSTGTTVTSTAGMVSNVGQTFTIAQIPTGTNVTLTATNTTSNCTRTFPVSSPNCNCPPVAAPTAPNNPTICQNEPTPALTVTAAAGLTVSWFANQTGGTAVGTGTAFTPTGTLVPGTYTFYAETFDPVSNCISQTRTAATLTVLAPPATPVNPGNKTICAGVSLNITIQGPSGTIYNWTNNNTAIGLPATGTGTITFMSAQVATAQVATITITAVSPVGNCSSAPQTFTITVNPSINAGITGDTKICLGETTTLTATGGPKVTWSTAATTASITVSPTQTTTYTATVSNLNGTCPNTATTTVMVSLPSNTTVNATTCIPAEVGTTTQPFLNIAGCDSIVTRIVTLDLAPCAPTVVLIGDTLDCAGGSTGSLRIVASGGTAPYTYLWSGNGQNGTGQISTAGGTASISNLGSGLYTVTITTASGSTATVTASVLAPAPLTITAAAQLTFNGFALRCSDSEDATITTTVSGGSASYSYLWNNNTTTATLTGIAAGNYTVTVTDAKGCTNTATETVVAPPPVGFVLQTLPTKCGDLFADGNVSPYGGSSPFIVDVDGTPSADLRIRIPDGTHTIQVTDANGCTADTSVTITIPPLPLVVLPADTTILLGTTFQLEAQTNVNVWQSIVWTPLPDPNCADCLVQVWTPVTSGVYQIQITDTSGCTGTDEIRLIVRNEINLYIPNAFSPDLDGKNDFWQFGAGPGIELLEEVRVYDRWGELVYFWNEPLPVDQWPGWDGKARDKQGNLAVYVYYVWVRSVNGERILAKGDVTVFR